MHNGLTDFASEKARAEAQNPSGHANCDTSGVVTIILPEGYQLHENNHSQKFIQNESIAWQVLAPAVPQQQDSILVYISERPKDLNNLEYANITSDSAFIIVQNLNAFLKIVDVAITSPAGARDDTLSTYQTFDITAKIVQQMLENISAEVIPPADYEELGFEIT